MSNDAQRKNDAQKPVAASDYAYRIAGEVYWDWEPDGDPDAPISTLDLLTEAVRRGYELGYAVGSAQ